MAKNYLDYDGLLYLWQKLKTTFAKTGDVPTKTSDLTNDSGYITSSSVPTASTTTPNMDGTASAGSESKWARGDHKHPTDTSRVPTTRKINGKALSADITLEASDIQTSDGEDVETVLGGKVDAVSGKGLSTNDYTSTEKDKLAGIASGAEVNVNADWNATSGDAQILNKPTIPSAGTGTSYPVMDGTRSLGTQAGYARVDHVHPSDTSRVPTTRKVNGHALSADVDVTASDVGLGNVVDGANVKYVSKESVYDGLGTKYTFDVPDGTSDGVEVYSASIVDYGINYMINSTVPKSSVGNPNGVCNLDENGLVPTYRLPSYVDDVIEAYARSGQTALSQDWLSLSSADGPAITPETGKIYVLMADSGDYSANTQFRWGGTAYVKLNDGGVSSITNAEIDTIVAS